MFTLPTAVWTKWFRYNGPGNTTVSATSKHRLHLLRIPHGPWRFPTEFWIQNWLLKRTLWVVSCKWNAFYIFNLQSSIFNLFYCGYNTEEQKVLTATGCFRRKNIPQPCPQYLPSLKSARTQRWFKTLPCSRSIFHTWAPKAPKDCRPIQNSAHKWHPKQRLLPERLPYPIFQNRSSHYRSPSR